MCCRLQRFEKTNEMLTNCNSLSISHLKTVGPEFKRHVQLLLEMKKDLDYIFKKIRNIKSKLSVQFPEEFTDAVKSNSNMQCQEEVPKYSHNREQVDQEGQASESK